MIIRKSTATDGRDAWTLESWLAETNKPVHLRFLQSAIDLGFDPFRQCVGGINPDGTPAREFACDKYPIIGESQCPACKNGICGLCNRSNPTPFPHGRIMCRECASGVEHSVGELAPYDGHEWRAAVIDGRASETKVVCAECGIRATIGEWPEVRCILRLAPASWQPAQVGSGDGRGA